jgi:hypothetical protein
MTQATMTCETSAKFNQSTRRYNPEDGHLRSHRRDNLKSYLVTCTSHWVYILCHECTFRSSERHDVTCRLIQGSVKHKDVSRKTVVSREHESAILTGNSYTFCVQIIFTA